MLKEWEKMILDSRNEIVDIKKLQDRTDENTFVEPGSGSRSLIN